MGITRDTKENELSFFFGPNKVVVFGNGLGFVGSQIPEVGNEMMRMEGGMNEWTDTWNGELGDVMETERRYDGIRYFLLTSKLQSTNYKTVPFKPFFFLKVMDLTILIPNRLE